MPASPSDRALSRAFSAQLSLASLRVYEAIPDLEALLARHLAAARRAWPDLALPDDAFLAHLVRQLEAEAPSESSLRSIHAADLFLAYACARGDARAIELWEEAFLSKLRRAVGRLDPSKAFVDEVFQRLRQKLLMGKEGAEPKLGEYRGRGPLATWLRAAALSVAVDLRRERKEHLPLDDDAILEVHSPGDDPELSLLRKRYRADFKQAFDKAFRALDARDRNLLRLHLLEGLTIVQLAAMYQVHRATLSRWIDSAQQQVLDGTRSALAERLRLSRAEIESLTRALRSQLEVSLSALLKSQGPPK